MAELPNIHLNQGSDAPQHLSYVQSILSELAIEKRSSEFKSLNVESDFKVLVDQAVSGDNLHYHNISQP